MSDFGRIHPNLLTGDEPFHQGLDPTRTTIRDFWRWSCSDPLSHAKRRIPPELTLAHQEHPSRQSHMRR